MSQISGYYKFNLLLVVLFVFRLVKCDQEEVIDLYDLLDENYMPGKLLLLENISKISGLNTNSTENSVKFHYGSAEEAISTMGYHRKMMNEYLCRTYVSEKILSGITLTRTKRKSGNVSDPLPELSSLELTEELLNDEGSTKYKEWLKRSATLQDIYRQFENPAQHGNQETQNRNDGSLGTYAGPLDNSHYEQSTVAPTVGSAAKVGYISDGTYTYSGDHVSHPGYGYGPPAPIYEDFTYEEQHHYAPKYYSKNKKKEELTQLFEVALTALAYLSFGMFLIHVLMCIMSAGSHANVTTVAAMPMSMGPTAGMMAGGGTFNSAGGGQPTHPGGTASGGGTETGGTGSETGTGGDGTEITGEGDGTGDGADGDDDGNEGGGDNGADDDDDGIDVGGGGDDGDDGIGTNNDDGGTENDDEDTEIITSENGDGMSFRFKRNANGFTKTSILNEMARKILISIDTALMAENDNGECLRRSLCENNKYSRGLNENGKYWIPVWRYELAFWTIGKRDTAVDIYVGKPESIFPRTGKFRLRVHLQKL